MAASGVRDLLVALTSSAALAIVVTWPLAATFGMLPVGCDGFYSSWTLAWETHAIATRPASIADANIFWPAQDTLFYGPLALGSLPFFAPIYLTTGNPVWAANGTVLLCFILTGASMHWVVWRWTRSHPAGFVAASTLLTTPWLSQTFIPLVPHLAAFQLFPLIVYLAQSDLEPRRAFWLTAAVIGQCLTDLVYVAPAVLTPLALLSALRLARACSRRSGMHLAAVVVMSSIALAPLLHRYAAVFAKNPGIGDQTLWFDANFATTFLPRDLIAPNRPAAFRATAVTIVAIGIALTLSRRGGWMRLGRGRAWRAGLFWCVAGFLISLGSPVVLGSIELIGPQGVLARWFPVFERIRAPNRLGIASLMGFSILTGVGFATIVRHLRFAGQRLRQRQAWQMALALIAFAILRVDFGPRFLDSPLSLPRVTVPRPSAAIIGALARAPGPLVEVPNGRMPQQSTMRLFEGVWFATRQGQAMLNSTFHWHPILNGYSSYFPTGFARRLELADDLPGRGSLETLVEETDLRFVWVHLDKLNAGQRARWDQIMLDRSNDRPALRLVASDEANLLFHIAR